MANESEVTEELEMETVVKPSPKPDLKTSVETVGEIEVTEDTACGIGCIRGQFLQKFARENVYVLIYGILGCIHGAYFAYFNGTITTLERRFKIPSKTMGIIATGNDMVIIFVSPILSYYSGKGHRPRWVGLGIYTIVISCIMFALPHVLYGAGEDVLEYTVEYGGSKSDLLDDSPSNHSTKQLCHSNSTIPSCTDEGEGIKPSIILFVTQIIQGIGGCLYFTAGTSYMDDNVEKSRMPALLSISYVLRMLGPVSGFWLSSVCLRMFVVPTLTPVISESDPRWIGAWWLGNLIIGLLLFLLATIIMLFPRTLPRTAAQKIHDHGVNLEPEKTSPKRADMKDMGAAFKRLLMNPIYNCNNLASAFNALWYMAYWVFLSKYMETQYRKAASVANFVTGTVTLIFSTVGILLAGILISKYKPRARILAGWNVFIGIVTGICLLSYKFLGCSQIDEQSSLMASRFLTNSSQNCVKSCHCDYVIYSPVCSENGETYLTPCHAGCKDSIEVNGTKIYTNCDCIEENGKAFDGACPTECGINFKIFVALICVVTFVGSTGRPSNFLIQLRCIDVEDKSIALGFSIMFLSLFAFTPSPILFGYILDKACLIWGKSCDSSGNCWLYDSRKLRNDMNLTAVGFVSIATCIDAILWYLIKDLKMFDDVPNS